MTGVLNALETVEKVIDIIEDYLANPAEEGLIPTLQTLQNLCVEWAGEESADRLFEAFVALDEALKTKRPTIGGLSTLYWGVSTRHITRPLVIAPRGSVPQKKHISSRMCSIYPLMKPAMIIWIFMVEATMRYLWEVLIISSLI